MNISELMRKTGISRKAIYLYEEKGLISPIKSETNGYREYGEEDLQRLKTILRFRELDLPIAAIARLFSNPENADIYLQAAMEGKKREIAELSLTIGRLNTVINRMPPNGSLDDFNGIAAAAFSEEQQAALMYKIQKDYPREYNRRILMNSFEAFLDRSIDTVAKREIWQRILELNEEAITQDLLEGYAYFYGTYSAEELELDFQLRRSRVTAIAACRTESDYRQKAADIFRDAADTVCNPQSMKWWKEYYLLFVRPMVESYGHEDGIIGNLINELSPTLEEYNESFRSIAVIVEQMFKSEEGRKVLEGFEKRFGPDFPRDIMALTYFDFYNSSLRKIMQKRK